MATLENLTLYDVQGVARDTAIKVMRGGRSTHPGDPWRFLPEQEHILHAINHLGLYGLVVGDPRNVSHYPTNEDLENALTRIAMALAIRQALGHIPIQEG